MGYLVHWLVRRQKILHKSTQSILVCLCACCALCRKVSKYPDAQVPQVSRCFLISLSPSNCLVAQSYLTLCNPRLLCSWDFPGKNTGVGCHFPFQVIFPSQGLNPHLLLGKRILYLWATGLPICPKTPALFSSSKLITWHAVFYLNTSLLSVSSHCCCCC